MDELAKLLAVAAEKLGFEAARIWSQIVLYTFIKHLIGSMIDVLVIVGIPLVIWKTLDWAALQDDIEEWFGYVFSVGLVLGVVLWIIALFSLTTDIPTVFAPEARAVIDLLNKK